MTSTIDAAAGNESAPLAANVTLDAAAQAALTQQVLQTQQNLVNSQNTLFQIWVSYQTSRMNLYLDLEQMPLDDLTIAARLGVTRQQVINLRKSARARLTRRMAETHHGW